VAAVGLTEIVLIPRGWNQLRFFFDLPGRNRHEIFWSSGIAPNFFDAGLGHLQGDDSGRSLILVKSVRSLWSCWNQVKNF
jgi:hypothetical protein